MTAVTLASAAEDTPARTAGTGTAPVARRRYPGWARWAVRVGSLALALVLWQWVTVADIHLGVRFDRLPTLTQLADSFGRHLASRQYYLDITQSLIRILTGFALAAVAGVAAGITVARSRLLADVLQPLFEVVRPIPAIALVPVAIMLFPTNEQGIVFITFTAAFFPILVSTRHAVHALPTVWEDAVRTMGGGRVRILFSVVLPGILPGVCGGLSVGMGVAWICVISAEMISGDFGIGYRTWQAYTIVDYPGVLVGMATIGVLGWVTSGVVELLGRRATRWLPARTGGRNR
jgi:NitT/TauT family transport system permease protein